tara:strand:+ start:2915 stop:3262 length:348 start_codon:yes stop_codon:yes gene_type:complete
MRKKKLSYEELEEYTEKFLLATWDFSIIFGALPSRHEREMVKSAALDLISEYRIKTSPPMPKRDDYSSSEEYIDVCWEYFQKYSTVKKDKDGKPIQGIIGETSDKAQQEHWEVKP